MGAAVYEIGRCDARDVDGRCAWLYAAAGTVVAGLVGYFAIMWLTRIVRSGRIWCFALYLIVLAIAVLSTRRSSAGRLVVERRSAFLHLPLYWVSVADNCAAAGSPPASASLVGGESAPAP